MTDVFADAGYRTMGTGELMHSKSVANKRLFQTTFDVEQRWSPLDKRVVRYTDADLPTKATDTPRHAVDFRGQTLTLPLNGMPSDRRPHDHSGESFDWGGFEVPDSAMGDHQITDWAIERLEDEIPGPFFLGVGYYRPHIPLWVPRRYLERFADTDVALPPHHATDLDDLSAITRRRALKPITGGSHATVLRFDQWKPAVAAYLACVTFVDVQVGRLLDALDRSPHADNTILVLWSDHGWHLGEKQHWGKWTGWERSTRVPLVIVPPRNATLASPSRSRRIDDPVGLIDLFPTLIDLCDLPFDEPLDGVNLTPIINGDTLDRSRVIVTTFGRGNVSLVIEPAD